MRFIREEEVRSIYADYGLWDFPLAFWIIVALFVVTAPLFFILGGIIGKAVRDGDTPVQKAIKNINQNQSQQVVPKLLDPSHYMKGKK